MRLELFDMLDDTSKLMEENHDLYVRANKYLVDVIEEIISDNNESVVDIGSRIKTSDSVREKIIRQKLYHNHHTGEDLLAYLHDLIGISIKVQFIRDEIKMFELIKLKFSKLNEEGLSYNSAFPNVFLDLRMRQPQPQKNGYNVYRMDGYVVFEDHKINFELQIKAMVYSFWSEVEHKVVYKNNHYTLNNEFMTQMLASVRNTLTSVDKQLSIIFDQMNKEINENKQLDDSAIKNVIAKALNDLFIDKIKASIGISIDFKKVCDLLADFLYNRILASDDQADSTIAFRKIRDMISEVFFKSIDFESPIEFSNDVVSDDRFTSTISKAFLIYMNSDFEWYVFFKMLFELLPNSNSDDFEFFINLYRLRFMNDNFVNNLEILYDEEQMFSVINDILGEVALSLVELDSIQILHDDKCNEVAKLIEEFSNILLKENTTFTQFEQSKAFMLNDLHKSITNVFKL